MKFLDQAKIYIASGAAATARSASAREFIELRRTRWRTGKGGDVWALCVDNPRR